MTGAPRLTPPGEAAPGLRTTDQRACSQASPDGRFRNGALFPAGFFDAANGTFLALAPVSIRRLTGGIGRQRCFDL